MFKLKTKKHQGTGMLLKLQKKNIKTLSKDKNALPQNATAQIAGGISADFVCCTDDVVQQHNAALESGGNSRASDCCTMTKLR